MGREDTVQRTCDLRLSCPLFLQQRTKAHLEEPCEVVSRRAMGGAMSMLVEVFTVKAELLGLRRLFRGPYRGPICVIEVVGAELKPSANRGKACSLYPEALLRLAPGCATRRAPEPLIQYVKPLTLQHAGCLDWRSPFGLLSKGLPDLRVEWTHGSVSGETQVEEHG